MGTRRLRKMVYVQHQQNLVYGVQVFRAVQHFIEFQDFFKFGQQFIDVYSSKNSDFINQVLLI